MRSALLLGTGFLVSILAVALARSFWPVLEHPATVPYARSRKASRSSDALQAIQQEIRDLRHFIDARLQGISNRQRTAVADAGQKAPQRNVSKRTEREDPEIRSILKHILSLLEMRQSADLQEAKRIHPRRNDAAISALISRYAAGEIEAVREEHLFLSGPDLVRIYGPPLWLRPFDKNGTVAWTYRDSEHGYCAFRMRNGFVVDVVCSPR